MRYVILDEGEVVVWRECDRDAILRLMRDMARNRRVLVRRIGGAWGLRWLWRTRGQRGTLTRRQAGAKRLKFYRLQGRLIDLFGAPEWWG